MESCEFSNGVILSYSIVTNLHVRGSGRFIQVLVQVYCMIMVTVCMLGKSVILQEYVESQYDTWFLLVYNMLQSSAFVFIVCFLLLIVVTRIQNVSSNYISKRQLSLSSNPIAQLTLLTTRNGSSHACIQYTWYLISKYLNLNYVFNVVKSNSCPRYYLN